LDFSTTYTATIIKDAADVAGNLLASNHTWTFTTTPQPIITATSPLGGTQDFAFNSAITATFNKVMKTSTVNTNTFMLSKAGIPVTGNVNYSGTTATFTPTDATGQVAQLDHSTAYEATITTGVQDEAGNAMASNKIWSFSTSAAPDNTPPNVTPTSPSDGDKRVLVNAAITATFSETMATASVSTTTFTLFNGTNKVEGAVRYSGTTATFTPNNQLAYSTVYITTITTGVTDTSGNAMTTPVSWTFTTQVPPINDTGITSSQCYQAAASSVLGDCTSTAAKTLSPTQDGMVGRDAIAATDLGAGTDGKLGFSFTLVDGGACVQDNVTGLMWESKTAAGLHAGSSRFTNRGNNIVGDASTFVTAVNTAALCGFNDWRLPTVDELQSIVDYGVAFPGPTIDTIWFPNTQSDVFWSSSPYVGSAVDAWYVYFYNGFVVDGPRISYGYVRLVRAGQ
jgi:hypothetical protein